ncbi:polysaccharide deacetylase family protein [Dictyobacter vulcani]|uniref:polysaccharide deacetylase family protein n=1 Tax=Dictyobacter vulcani TaxID=2607529 RepID=UPI001386CE36|nr:polysaccharide deacetylase family protein [Dictyobacter vulcani]
MNPPIQSTKPITGDSLPPTQPGNTPNGGTQLPVQPGSANNGSTNPPLQAQVIGLGRRDVPKIALTFDDGPDPQNTPQILSILQQHNVHATFFAVGEHAQENPDLVHQIVSGGNVLGNHTWDHADLKKLKPEDQAKEIGHSADELQQLTHVRPTLLRPPYGAINDSLKNEAALAHDTIIIWNVDTEDWKTPGKDAIVNTAVHNARNGAIILMHDGGGDRSQTIQALPEIITQLQQRHFQLVTVPELLQDMHKPI